MAVTGVLKRLIVSTVGKASSINVAKPRVHHTREAADGLAQLLLSASLSFLVRTRQESETALWKCSGVASDTLSWAGKWNVHAARTVLGMFTFAMGVLKSPSGPEGQPVSKALVWTWRRKRMGSCLSRWVLCLVVSPGVWTYGGWDMRIMGEPWEHAGGCTEADSLKSGQQSLNTQVPAKGNETDSIGQPGTRKAYTRGGKANMYQELENTRLDCWVETWGEGKA